MNDKPKITYNDLQNIISDAKATYTAQKTPMWVSFREVTDNDPVHVALIESFIMHLNRRGLLTTLVEVDYQERLLLPTE